MRKAIREFFWHFRSNPLSWLVAVLLLALLGLGVYFLYHMNVGMRREALVHDQQQHLQMAEQLIEQRVQLALAELRTIAERNKQALEQGQAQRIAENLQLACAAYPDMGGLTVRAPTLSAPIAIACSDSTLRQTDALTPVLTNNGPTAIGRLGHRGFDLDAQQLVVQWRVLGERGEELAEWQLLYPLQALMAELGGQHGATVEKLLVSDVSEWFELTSTATLLPARGLWPALQQQRVVENEAGMFLSRELWLRDPADRSHIERWWLVTHVPASSLAQFDNLFYRQLVIMFVVFGLMLMALYLYSRRVIGEQVQMVAELQRKQSFVDSLLDSSPDAMLTVDTQGNIVSYNACAETLFGHRPGALEGRGVELLLPSDYQRQDQDYALIYTQLAEMSSDYSRAEMIGIRAQGDEFPVEVTYCRLKVPDQAWLLLIIREVTERKVAEQELNNLRIQYFQQEKMAQVGLLLAGILHEVGNPLAAIEGLLAEVLDSESEVTDAARANIEMVLTQTARIRNICHDVSGFSSPRQHEKGPLSLNQILQSAATLLSYDKRWRQIALEMQLDPNLPAMEGVADQLTQVVMNLLVNAADAFEGGGQREPRIMVCTACVGDDMLMVSISDNGSGIAAESMFQIFDNFYTTKPKGKGTGLGLSICEQLVEEHGGSIEIESRVGEGTAVRLFFSGMPLIAG